MSPTGSPTESPTNPEPTPFPTRQSLVTNDSPSTAYVTVTQTLNGISSASFDSTAQGVLTDTVKEILGSYQSVSCYVKNFNDARRLLLSVDLQSDRRLTGSLQVTYEIGVSAQGSGFPDTSQAATSVISTLTAAVQSSAFNTQLAFFANSNGCAAMLSVTSSNTITARDSSNDSSEFGKALGEAAKTVVTTIAVAVVISILFCFAFCYLMMFYVKHERCPRVGLPWNSNKFEQAPVSEPDPNVELTVHSNAVKTTTTDNTNKI